MADRFSTHHIEFYDDVVIKRYSSWHRGEPHREWTALTLLAEHAPGVAPTPMEASLGANPPMITMSRLPGRVLRGEHATDEQVKAIADALNRLHQVPARVVEAVEPAPWGPVVAVDKVRALADKQPDLGDDPPVRQAYQVGAAWLASTDPDKLTVNRHPPVLGLADGNHANLLWDQRGGRVWLIDWEDSGSNDRAFELGEVTEHISRIDGGLDADQLLAHIDLTSGEAARVLGFRRLVALGWFLQLGPSGPAAPHNPPGTLERLADRVLQLFG
ncbi:phosphotransferase family protein [Nonomuraea sp. SYSU D8015]|uniref:phosphotransferase family protein n=1 Tax=Nonomuraea sp. SYSU D8015 TaxID=2593644 RepID=UPI00166100F6|nr:aminoglycoside phosphotransferase family protein [Nonomuraea sp. SYSU D8015]